jgi:hypothetical protein
MNKIRTKNCLLKLGACFYFLLFAKTLSSGVIIKCCSGKLFFSTVLLCNYKNQSNSGSVRQYFDSPMTQNDPCDTMRSITCCSGKPKNKQLQVLSWKLIYE